MKDMLLFGDASETVVTQARLAELRTELSELPARQPGIERHSRLVGLFIAAAELLQGVSDAEFERVGADTPSPARSAGARLLNALAAAIQHSWLNEFRLPPLDHAGAALAALGRLRLPDEIRCKRQEGFAFYAVYPEGYLEAARRLTTKGDVRVIGIRSIGTALGGLVATGAGASQSVTVRPVGPPFERRLSLAPELARTILAGRADAYAIVDEGPGLSGSSFGAVADFLEGAGVEPSRIHFFPSHRGELGPHANAAHRARWRSAQRHVVDFDTLALWPAAPWQGLSSWIGDLAPGPITRLEDLSGGRWRSPRYGRAADWPPANVQQERRKFLAEARDTKPLLLKFVGLGRVGERKLARARALAEAGLAPPVLGLRYGFLVETWLSEAEPLDPQTADRDWLAAGLARYLGFRAKHFVAAEGGGAGLAELGRMLRHNAAEAFGEQAAHVFSRTQKELRALEPFVRRVATDNRLHAWEWLRSQGGRLLKADAVDHCEAHDLVGCQDIAWDLAGARVEFDLSQQETTRLQAAVGEIGGHPVNVQLVAALEPCYLAFQLGAYASAAVALGGIPEEAARLEARARRYAGLLRRSAAAWA